MPDVTTNRSYKKPDATGEKLPHNVTRDFLDQIDADMHGAVGLATWTAPTLLNSWVNFDTGVYFGAGYTKQGVTVKLRGAIKNGTATSGTVLFTLPVGYRPTKLKMFAPSSVNSGSTAVLARVGVQDDGDVVIYAGDNFFLSLDGIEFEAS